MIFFFSNNFLILLMFWTSKHQSTNCRNRRFFNSTYCHFRPVVIRRIVVHPIVGEVHRHFTGNFMWSVILKLLCAVICWACWACQKCFKRKNLFRNFCVLIGNLHHWVSTTFIVEMFRYEQNSEDIGGLEPVTWAF